MKITSKGQVTIPREIREDLGFMPLTEVAFVREGDRVYLCRPAPGTSRGARVLAALRGKATTKLSTDQIMAMTRGG